MKAQLIPYQENTNGPNMLPHVELKTKSITFDDRLQQVRVIEKDAHGRLKHGFGSIKFLNYRDDDGFYYVKKYRPNWDSVVRL